jgi:hypothetical protein
MALQLVGRGAQQTRSVDAGERGKYEHSIAQQLDLMCYQSEIQRDKILKQGWTSEIERLYNMTDIKTPVPTFRPRITIPEIQFQMLAEASDLSDVAPLPYIVDKRKDERDQDRERALQAQWKNRHYNLQAFMAILWSLYAGNGYLRVGYDPDAQNGMGEVIVVAPHPATVYPDPFAVSDEDMKYVIFEEFLYINEVRRRWPENGFRVTHHRPGSPSTLDTTLQLPEGPMSMLGGLPGSNDTQTSGGESRVRVRTAFVNDYSVKELKKQKQTHEIGVLQFPKAVPAYPNGRLIVECEGVSLLDKPNPFPLKIKPLVTVFGMPPLVNYFAPSFVNFTIELQRTAERMLTQVFENAVRVNNVITFVYEDSGIDIEEYGGIPGGVHQIAQGSKKPEIIAPPAFPQHMIEMPMKLLELCKELNGFTPSRKGMPGAGNLSVPLFDASVLQSQSMTRMRGRFLARSFQRLAWIVFAMMGRFYTQHRNFPSFQQDDQGLKYESVGWDPIEDNDPSMYEIQLDENSVRPFSQVAMRTMVPTLRQLGMIDAKTGREMLELPNSDIIDQRMAQEAAAAAAAGLKAGAKGKKK